MNASFGFGFERLSTITVYILIFSVVNYLYLGAVLTSYARKLGYKRVWISWIPFARWAMVLQWGGFPWGLVFLFLFPSIGGALVMVISSLSLRVVFKNFGYPVWPAYVPIIMIVSIPITFFALIILNGGLMEGFSKGQLNSVLLPYLFIYLLFLAYMGFVAWNDKN